MKKLSVILLMVLQFGVLPVGAQDHPPIHIPETEARSLTSSAVSGYEYGLWVALPQGYATVSERYPVLYVLDATNQFAMVVQTYRLLRAFNEVPPLLLVGIAHIDDFIRDRARDFMPTKLSQEEVRGRYGAEMAGYVPTSGGAAAFLTFLRDEAIPFIEAEYRVDSSSRGLFGHSAGGLFALYALFNGPSLFDRYLVASSAVWWDDFAVLRDEVRYASEHEELPVRILATVGSDEGDLIVGGWERLRDRMQTRAYRGLHFSALMMEGESHVSIPPRTYSRALRVLFGSN